MTMRGAALPLPLLLGLLLLGALPSRAAPPAPAASRNAFATVYTHSAPRAAAEFEAARVMLRSLALTRPEHDVVVLVSPDTPAALRERLLEDAAARGGPAPRVLETEAALGELARAPEAAAALRAKCPGQLDWLALWALQEYERVVYLAPETLVLLALDDLFRCGHLCFTYANVHFWSASVLALRPSSVELARLTAEATARSAELAAGHARGRSCQEEHWDFVVRAWPDMAAAPLFDPAAPERSEAPRMRLNLMYELPSLYFYEYFHWAHYQINVKVPEASAAYRSLRDGEWAERTPTAGARFKVTTRFPVDVPVFSMSFAKPRPYGWVESLFFNLVDYWYEVRAILVPGAAEEPSSFLASRLVAGLVGAAVVHVLVRRAFGAGAAGAAGPAGRFRARLRSRVSAAGGTVSRLTGSAPLVYDAALSAVGVIGVALATTLFAMPMIPPVTAPWAAWPVFVALLVVGAHASLAAVTLLAGPPCDAEPPSWRLQLPGALTLVFTLVALRADIHIHFVEKTVAMGVLLFLTLVAFTSPYRKIGRALLAAQAGPAAAKPQ